MSVHTEKIQKMTEHSAQHVCYIYSA